MTYKEQLLHPKWQLKKSEIMIRDNAQCQRCFDRDTTLHVHHKNYDTGKLAWEYDNDNFVLLCESCHSLFHKSFELDIVNSMLHSVMIDDFTETDIFVFEYHLLVLNDRFGKGGLKSLIKYVLAVILSEEEI